MSNVDWDKIEKFNDLNYTVFPEIHEIRMGVCSYCTRSCDFCGASKHDKTIMSIESFRNLMEGTTESLKRITLNAFGEPLMNPNIVDIVSLARTTYPKLQISTMTNYDRLKGNFGILKELFKAGLNNFQVDIYDDVTLKDITANIDKIKSVLPSDVEFVNFHKSDINLWTYNPNRKIFVLCNSINGGFKGKKTRSFHTWGSNLPYNVWSKYSDAGSVRYPKESSCTDLMKYMTIHPNGNVLLCCRDGSKSTYFGNINETPAIEIWQSEKMHIARFLLKNKRRDLFLPCILCNFVSIRDGIHPYWGPNLLKEDIQKALKEINVCHKDEPIYDNLMIYKERGMIFHPIIQELLEG